MDLPDRMSFDCAPIDDILDGGLEAGIITNVYGESGTGKTNVCIQAAVSCIEAGDPVVYVDTEGGFSAERFLQMHDDRDALEDVVMLEPMTFEQQRDVFDRLPSVVDEHDAGLVIVDSLVALYRIRLQGDEVSETNRELSRQLSVLSKIARSEDIPVLVTNQVYSSFESDEVQMVGRDVPTYWSKCLLKLEENGSDRRMVVEKHRSRPEGLAAVFSITEHGIEGNGDTEMEVY
ncbi:MAG: DNA repair and recombination protein RadB [Candidatus Nanohaloarchaeota archaeon QJJ-5]|nr:DNA repair and recombination protein RadB [Candidatus Nanohaloarchaeota archaeon QJJ-5]